MARARDKQPVTSWDDNGSDSIAMSIVQRAEAPASKSPFWAPD